MNPTKKIYLASVAAACLVTCLTGSVNAQVYDEKFEITDPTFEQRSAEEKAEEQGQSAPTAAQPAKPGKKKKGEKKAEAAPPAPPAKWTDTLTVDGFIEGGIAVNPNQPFNGLNWGHLYTDRANTPIFNSAVLTVQRPLDPKAQTYDYGFKLQGMVGEDMRYNHYMGELDYVIPSRTQIGPIEAHVLAHLPINTSLTEGGIDLKVGQFVTYNGAELITAKDNLFYSHSYIFNFGPFVDTGVMVTTHSKSWLDIYTGIISGNNMTLGGLGDNNASPSFHGGFGFNLLDGNLVIMAMTTTGPENSKQTDKYGVGWPTGFFANPNATGVGVGLPWPYPVGPDVNGLPFTSNMSAWGVPGQCACNVNQALRSWNNLTTTWKATDRLTTITDISFMMESGWNPSAFGVPQRNWLGVNGIISAAGGTALPFGIVGSQPMGATAYGIAQNVSYKYDDVWLLKARLEYFRDSNGFFVSAFPGYFDAANVQKGLWCPSCINRTYSTLPGYSPFGSATQFGQAYTGVSYLALTVGTTITPKLPDNVPYLTGLMIRPELRWDQAVNGTSPFFSKNGMSSSQGMFNMDIILPFSLL